MLTFHFSQKWHEYAKVLYDIPGQPPLPHPHESTFFTPQNVRNAIDQLQFGKVQDHDGLVGGHFIYARDTLLPLLAHIGLIGHFGLLKDVNISCFLPFFPQ